MRKISYIIVSALLCSQLTFSSSQEGLEDERQTQTLMPKSLKSHLAFQKRDEDYKDFVTDLLGFLEGREVAFDQDNPLYLNICRELQQDGGDENLRVWAQKSLKALQNNIEAGEINSAHLMKVKTVEQVEDLFKHFVILRNSYFLSRQRNFLDYDCVPSTKPQDFSALNALSKLSVETSVDRHALMCEIIKEAYTVLLKLDENRAHACFERIIAPGTFLSKYLTRKISYVFDPDTCTEHDRALASTGYNISACDEGEKEAPVQVFVSTGNPTQDRLRRKLAQKQGKVTSAPPTKSPAQESKRKARRPSKNEIAVIKEAAAFERAQLEQRQAEKRRRIEVQAAHAQHMKELVQQARLEARTHDSEADIIGFSNTSENAPASKKRAKEKRRGVADIKKRQRQDSPRAPGKRKSTARASSGEKEETREKERQRGANLYKRLVAFWGTAAGQTYHDVTLLFRGLGGRVTEKKGGSSHVTLTYYTLDGQAHKHELWRPHGGDNTFGFRTTAALQAFFKECGLTLQ